MYTDEQFKQLLQKNRVKTLKINELVAIISVIICLCFLYSKNYFLAGLFFLVFVGFSKFFVRIYRSQ